MVQIVEHLTVDELAARYRRCDRGTPLPCNLAFGARAVDQQGCRSARLWLALNRAVDCSLQPGRARGVLRRRNGRAARLLTPACLAAIAERIKTPPD